MIVCVCHRVSDQTIARAARSGMAFDDIQLELGVATQCGKCESCARSVWSECRSGQPTAHLKIDELRQQLARGTLQLAPVLRPFLSAPKARNPIRRNFPPVLDACAAARFCAAPGHSI